MSLLYLVSSLYSFFPFWSCVYLALHRQKFNLNFPENQRVDFSYACRTFVFPFHEVQNMSELLLSNFLYFNLPITQSRYQSIIICFTNIVPIYFMPCPSLNEVHSIFSPRIECLQCFLLLMYIDDYSKIMLILCYITCKKCYCRVI